MSRQTINVTPKLYQYLLDHTLREHQVLESLREETKKLTGAQMQISPEQGQFMALLVEMLKAKKTLDIGTFTGYSALVVALAISQDGKVITCDVSDESVAMAKTFWARADVSHKIESRIGNAVDTLDKLIADGQEYTFDFIFIDADKKNYPTYYEKSLILLRTGGMIAIDNVLWDGKVCDDTIQDENTKTIRRLNDFIHQDQRVSMSLLPIGDGLMLARKL